MSRTSRSTFTIAAAIALISTLTATAQYEKTKSTLVVADRVEVPGAVLEPGNYLVRITDQQSNRNVIVFQSPDGSKTYATTIATPHRTAKSIGETQFTFFTTPEGQPRVLRSWFPADDVNGQDFVYPAARAAQLRTITREEVPVATAEMTTTTTEPAPAPPVASAPPPPPAPVETTRETTVATAPPAPAPATDEALPQTASPYPLVGLLGSLSLAASFVLSRRRRSA
jgi:LPXTG-motif cell wall-anchored protein